MTAKGPNYSTRPVLRVNLSALKSNYKKLSQLVAKNTKVSASVKADAYGLGAGRISRALYGAGCRTYFVATAGEGKIVREAIGDNASIYVLNGPAPRDLTLFFGADLKPVINSLTQAQIWGEAIKNVKSPPFCALHIDTGMNRLGFTLEDFEKLTKNKKLLELIKPNLVMSHLACAPNKNDDYNERQLKLFRSAAAKFPALPMSLANTAGIYLGPKYHFQLVRPGIGLYGGIATDNPEQEKSETVISLMAPVLQVRHLNSGDKLGYDSTFTASKDITVAIVGAGYGDGIPWSFSSGEEGANGYATLQKTRVPVIGRVSMDLTALDISGLKKIPRLGDWAEFLGSNLETDAATVNTVNYEMMTRIGSRVRREYIN